MMTAALCRSALAVKALASRGIATSLPALAADGVGKYVRDDDADIAAQKNAGFSEATKGQGTYTNAPTSSATDSGMEGLADMARGLKEKVKGMATKAKDSSAGQTITEKAKDYAGRAADVGRVAKEHVKAAAKNQAQAMEDVTVGGAEASNVYPEHMKEAKKDMKQWGRETRAAAAGESPEDVKVRDLPPMGPGQDTVEDRVQDRKIKPQGGRAEGTQGPSTGYQPESGTERGM